MFPVKRTASSGGARRALRVLFVIPGAFEGNSMIFARRQASSMRELGVQVSFFHLRSRTSPVQMAREWVRFRRCLRRTRPDVVHAHFGTATALFAALAAPRRPLVITYRGSDLNPAPRNASLAEKARSLAGRLFSQLAALGADRIVCVSRALRQQLWWRRSVAVVLPSGVDAEVFRPESRADARQRLGWSDAARVILFNAGHGARVKRIDLARASTALASAAIPRLRLEVLDGRTPPDDIPALMNAADCLLLTSDAEGSPTVVQEALACNLPVVSVDVGDAAERLRGVQGARIVTRDPRDIARALVELVAEPRRSDGRNKIGEFSTRGIAREMHGIYRGLCEPWPIAPDRPLVASRALVAMGDTVVSAGPVVSAGKVVNAGKDQDV